MRRGAEKLALWIAAALALLAPLPLGGTPGPAKAALAALVALGLAALALARDPAATPPRALALLLLLTLGLPLLYVVPLPYPLVETLSPRLAEASRDALSAPEGLDEALAAADAALMESAGAAPARPAWRPLAADPDGAWEEGLRLTATLGAFLLALLAIRGPRDRRVIVAALALSALVQAGYGIAEYFGGAGTVFALDKSHDAGRAAGSFVNPNHFATLLVLGFFALVGLLASGESRGEVDDETPSHSRARLTALATLGGVLVVALLWSMSRGALTCAALALALFVAFGIGTRRSGRRLLHARLMLGLVVALLVAGALWLKPPDPVLARFGTSGDAFPGRVRIWSATLALAADFPAVGSGPGTLRHVETLYRPAEMKHRAIHAHNDYLEWVAETGVPGTLLLAAWLVVLAGGTRALLRRREERALNAALAAGLLALMAHALFEFSLQLLGVSLPAALLVAALLSPLVQGRPGASPAPGADPRSWRALALGAALLLLLFVGGFTMQARPLPPGAAGDRGGGPFALAGAEVLRQHARSEVASVGARLAAGEPVEPEEQERRLASALRAARAALARAPFRGETHLATWTAAQALVASRTPDAPPPGFPALTRHHLHRAEALAPASRARHVQLVRHWRLAGDETEARRVARRLLELEPGLYAEVYDLLGGAELDLGELMESTPNEPEAAALLARYVRRRGDDAGASIVLERALAREPGSPRLRLALADVLAARNRRGEALAILQESSAAAEPDWRRRLLRLEASLLIRERRFEDLARVEAEQRRLGEAPARLALQSAQAALARDEGGRAVALIEDALSRRDVRMVPRERLGLLVVLGRALEGEGEHRRALDAYREAAEIDPEHRAVKAYFERLDGALAGGS